MTSTTPDAEVGTALAQESARAGVTMLELRYGLEDKPGPVPAVLFGLQHVLVMFTAMIASPLVIGQLLNLSPELRATMVTGVMLGCGIGTVISALGLGFVGARLPLLLGAYAVYIGPVVAMAKATSLGAATTAMIIGGLVLFALSPVIGKLRNLFPPVVVGALLVITGVTLIRIAVNIAAGTNTPYAGHPLTIWLVVGSILLILAINRLTTGFLRALSVFIALVCLYLIAIPLGLADFTAVANAPWFRLPSIIPYGGLQRPDTGALVTVIVYHLVAAIYTMSITLALCKMLAIEGSERRIRGAVAADGLGSALAALFGGVPLISYDQNVGAISLTGVGSRFVVAVAGAILIAMALLPKIGAIIAIVPPFVLGGTLIFMFAMIAAVGVGILADSMRTQRDLLLLAASLGLSTAVNFAPPAIFEAVPQALRILASDGIVVGTVMAVVLNLVLPGRD
ncbi:MAG: purine/pyrimidine permease [Hyphomicrobiales bacterium]|nr:purine/pyrimidine permease [Hyphomicrobiales bacterium]MBV8826715.1 purine/pyrimidine permease [Hyphomicrobiales bacterium]MBV9427856.1 purine/pyrimidine permease [Bradyrhizobiaceae bacterium]